ncbi:MAG: hypothetical protein ACYDHO_08840 [Gaiellaceae bacterium]
MLPYDDYEKQPNARARLSLLFGLLGAALAPTAILVHTRVSEITLPMAVGGIAAGCTVLGFLALSLAKRARLRRRISLDRMGGAKQAALGRLLGKLVLGVGLGACISLAVYALLTRL